MDIDEGKDYEGTYTCGGKDHGKDDKIRQIKMKKIDMVVLGVKI